jgi:hypothetical protein
MQLIFKRENGRKHAIDTCKSIVARPTSDYKATRVFEDGYTVRLRIEFDNFQDCLVDPTWGISGGLCEPGGDV